MAILAIAAAMVAAVAQGAPVPPTSAPPAAPPAAMQAAVVQPANTYRPSGPWVMDYQEDLCLLTRNFAAGEARITLGFRQMPGDARVEVILLDRNNPDNVLRRGWAAIRPGAATAPLVQAPIDVRMPRGVKGRLFQLSEAALGGEAVSARVPGGQDRLLRFLLPSAALGTLASQASITVEQVGQPGYIIAVAALTKALTALRTCETDQVRSWGVAPERIAQPAEPVGDMGDWLEVNAFRRDRIQIEETTIRWTITTAGRAENCVIVRSSGQGSIDRTACERMVERARFRPARDGAGQPVPSVQSRRIIWMLG